MTSEVEYLLRNDVSTVPATLGTHTHGSLSKQKLKKYLILIRDEYQSLIKEIK